MRTIFKNYDSSDYNRVCDFLVELSKNNKKHINWNWARWEWMCFHPEFDHNTAEKIGLWFSNDELVGMTTYDHYFGEAFCAVKEGFEELEKDVLDYAVNNFSNENGIGIAVNNDDNHSIDLLLENGFVKHDNFENILEKKLLVDSFSYSLPEGITIENLNINDDLYKHHNVLWQGFENDGSLPVDELTMKKQKNMLTAPHLNSYLHLVAVNTEGEYVAYCGCWYNLKTDYAYIEPVCTIPQYRKKGLANSLIFEALKRAYSEGAKKAYVISDTEFYKNLGFDQHSRHTFYWHR